MIGEADYLIRRATMQLDCAHKAMLPGVAAIHLELASRYLAQAQSLIDAERGINRRDNVVSLRG